jgi:hypothetical protein
MLPLFVTAPAAEPSITVKLVYQDDDGSIDSEQVDVMIFNQSSFIVQTTKLLPQFVYLCVLFDCLSASVSIVTLVWIVFFQWQIPINLVVRALDAH